MANTLKNLKRMCDGTCSNCGECCIPNLPITLDEYYIIKDYIKENNIKAYPVKPDGDNLRLDCPFHDRDKMCCTIYPVRPEACRSFICSDSSCNIDKQRKYNDERADINGKHLNRFVCMDLLFYDNPITTILMVNHLFKPRDEKQFINILLQLGKDQEFFKKYDIPNCFDIAEAIVRGDIVLTEED